MKSKVVVYNKSLIEKRTSDIKREILDEDKKIKEYHSEIKKFNEEIKSIGKNIEEEKTNPSNSVSHSEIFKVITSKKNKRNKLDVENKKRKRESTSTAKKISRIVFFITLIIFTFLLNKSFNLFFSESEDRIEYLQSEEYKEFYKSEYGEDFVFDEQEFLKNAKQDELNDVYDTRRFYVFLFLSLIFSLIVSRKVFKFLHNKKILKNPNLLPLDREIEELNKEIGSLEWKIKSFKNSSEKTLKRFKEKIKNLEKEKIEIDGKIKTHKTIINNLNLESSRLMILKQFNNIYDKDDNQLLDILESESLDKILEKNQNEINEVEKLKGENYTKDLVKINLYLNEFQKTLQTDYHEILSSINERQSELVENFDKNYNQYKLLFSGVILMLKSIREEQFMNYYKLREIFDKLSIFETNFERKMIDNFKTNQNLIKSLIDVTNDNTNEILSSLSDIGVNTSYLSDISSSLDNISYDLSNKGSRYY